MTDTAADDASTQTFFFIRGVEEDAGECEWPDDAEKVRQALGESLNAKNVAFLLGAGCSSSRVDDREVGVPTMAPLAKEFTQSRETDDASFPTTEERELLLQQFGVDISAEEYSRNLERLMELLFSLRFALQRSSLESASTQLETVNSLIKKVQTFLWTKCTRGAFADGDTTVMALYESFYRKLVLRDRSLPRPWVFTTNYDLFNETAMDRNPVPPAPRSPIDCRKISTGSSRKSRRTTSRIAGQVPAPAKPGLGKTWTSQARPHFRWSSKDGSIQRLFATLLRNNLI